MFADNAQISHRQLFRQILLGLSGIYFLTVPVCGELRGRQGMLSLLGGMVLYLFLCIYFIRLKTVFRSPLQYMGKTAGRIFILLYLSWMWFAGVYLLLLIARITDRFLIEGSVPWVVIGLAGAAAYLGSHQGLERRGRMAEVCFPVVMVILVGMLLLGILRMKPEYLREMGPLSLKGWLKGTYEVCCLFLPFVFLPVALGNVKKPGETGRVMGSAVMIITGLQILGLLLLQGSFGLGGYEHKEYPVIDFMSGIRIPGDFLERVDIFWLAAVLFSVLFALGSVFFYNHELLVRVKMEKTAWIAAGGIVFAALVCQKEEVSPDFFLNVTAGIYGPLFLLLLLFGTGSARKKKALAALLALIFLPLTACGVSLESRVFPLAISADYQKGQYELIYGIPGLTQITGQDKKSTEDSQAQAVAYKGKEPKEAEENFNKNQENYLDMGHLKVLILGNGILQEKEALEEFLQYLEEKPAVAGNLYVFACDKPEELMSLDSQNTDSVGEYLTGILENNLEGKPKDAVTLQDLYNAWHREEEFPRLPIAEVVNKRPQIRQYSW